MSVVALEKAGVDMGVKRVTLYGNTYDLADLTTDEIDIFNMQFDSLLGTSDSVLRQVLAERRNVIFQGIRAIVRALEHKPFKGLNPGDTEIGMALPRPGFFKYNDTVKTDWTVSISTSWGRWLDASSGTGYTLSEDFGYIITHLVSLTTPDPYVQEVKFKIGRTELVPYDVSYIRLGDNKNQVAIFPIPTMLVLPEETFLAEIRGRASGTEELMIGGLIVGLGRILKQKSPSW